MLKKRGFPWIECLGLLVVLVYWYSVHPTGFSRGYSEDLGFFELARQLMAQQIQQFGQPTFVTDQVMTPFKVSVPYMTWSTEKDWLGAYFWMWNREFPFFWFYYGVSLVVSYLGVGVILRGMRLSKAVAWAMATVVVVFHLPRHFKTWYHYEHLLQHWVYWGIFLDAWVWQKFWRDHKWSWSLELWRGLCLLGVFGTAGYFWGPMLIIWTLVRVSMVILEILRRKEGRRIEIEGSWKSALFPLGFGLFLFVLNLRWFLPLFKEVQRLGSVPQSNGWSANIAFLVRPLWLETLKLFHFKPIDTPETVVTMGWSYWIPTVLAILMSRKKNGGPGLSVLAPFLIFLGIGILYMGSGPPFSFVQDGIQATVPFMKFFRACSRWGLFLPQMTMVLILLAWPELWARFQALRLKWAWAFVFIVILGLELTWLNVPVMSMPPMSTSMVQMLDGIKKTPGTTVLDLPFCVAGGNGICSEKQCPNYPASITPACLRGWHDKKVYGLYASRLMSSDCNYYNQPPYTSWFDAWSTQRCLTSQEWDDLCHYLSEHSEISAVLVYPEIWTALQDPVCLGEFDRRLGAPRGQDSVFTALSRGGEGRQPTRVIWYSGRCQ